ncbi:MAG: dienelactone hydrolase family protein, partial [Nostocoides sp.]
QLLVDASGSIDHLRAIPGSNGKVATIGFCSGGRQSVLAGTALSVDAVVDCYGAFVLSDPPADMNRPPMTIRDRLGSLTAPILGLFGADDSYPSPEEVSELDTILTAHGTPHVFHSYEGAGHAFFAVDRPAYRVEAAVDGWTQIADFYREHLGEPQGWGR